MAGKRSETVFDPLDPLVVENRKKFETDNSVRIQWDRTECIKNAPKAGLPSRSGLVSYHCRRCGSISATFIPKGKSDPPPTFQCFKCTQEDQEKDFGAKILNWGLLPVRVRGPKNGWIVPSRPGAEVVVEYSCPSCQSPTKTAMARTGRKQGELRCEKCLRVDFEARFGAKILNWDEVSKTEKNSATNPGTVKSKSAIRFICTSCGKESEKMWYAEGDGGAGLAKPICPDCQKEEIAKIHPKSTSSGENEVAEFIESIGHRIERNLHRIVPPHELDIVVPSRMVAVEYDGLYHHAEESGKSWDYHLKKTEACHQVGYRLIHIFEDEWKNKREVVCSRLASILRCPTMKNINARSCEIFDMSHQQHTQFMDSHHLQGSHPASEAYGLRVDGEIVACMTFSRPRMAIGNIEGWELLRFACVPFTTVRGGASRLLTHFRRKHPKETVISFADRRWSVGGVYEALGFKFQHVSRPSYWYVDHLKRFHRSTFTKHSLVAEGFDKEKSERQIMRERGFMRIWDCGTLVYRLDPPTCPASIPR